MIVQGLSCKHIYKPSLKYKNIYPQKILPLLPLQLEKGLDFVKENGQAANTQSHFLMQKSKLPPKRFCALRFAVLYS